jgi:hypothetical protein
MNNYKTLVAEAAEKYEKSLIADGVDEHYAKGMKKYYISHLRYSATVELVEKIAREAYDAALQKLTHTTKTGMVLEAPQYLTFKCYWTRFMGGEDGDKV